MVVFARLYSSTLRSGFPARFGNDVGVGNKRKSVDDTVLNKVSFFGRRPGVADLPLGNLSHSKLIEVIVLISEPLLSSVSFHDVILGQLWL